MSFTEPKVGTLVLRSWLQGREAFLTLEALRLGLIYHNGLRKDGVTPESFHQVSIALNVRTLAGLDLILNDLITVIMLHDIVEDKDFSLNAIEAKWGKNIRDAVELISKKTPGFKKKSLADYYDNMWKNPLAALAKGADRINNFQTMDGVFDREKQKAYMEEVEKHLLPMLKNAREAYPEYQLALEGLKYMLLMQIKLIKTGLIECHNCNDTGVYTDSGFPEPCAECDYGQSKRRV